jgi:hypothetical protein
VSLYRISTPFVSSFINGSCVLDSRLDGNVGRCRFCFLEQVVAKDKRHSTCGELDFNFCFVRTQHAYGGLVFKNYTEPLELVSVRRVNQCFTLANFVGGAVLSILPCVIVLFFPNVGLLYVARCRGGDQPSGHHWW